MTLLTRPTSLWLLNGFDLRTQNRSVAVALPGQRVLAFLALQRRPPARQSVATALWPDLPEQSSSARLRSALWRLPSPATHRLVTVDAGRLHLSEHVDVDIRIAQDDTRVADLDVRHLIGDVLSDWTDDWVEVERERVRQLRLHRLEQLSEHAQSAGCWSVALDAALAAVAIEPLRESAHRRVMRIHLAEDNPSEALRQYHLIRQLLRRELGLPPAAATRDVICHLLGRPLDTPRQHRSAT